SSFRRGLPLLRRVRLGRVDRGVVLALCLGGVDERQKLLRGGDVVPAAVLEVDEGLLVAVDRDDAANDVGEPLQLGPLGIDAHELVSPPSFQFLVAQVGRVHSEGLLCRWSVVCCMLPPTTDNRQGRVPVRGMLSRPSPAPTYYQALG